MHGEAPKSMIQDSLDAKKVGIPEVKTCLGSLRTFPHIIFIWGYKSLEQQE